MDVHSPLRFVGCIGITVAAVLALGEFGMVSAATKALVVEAGKHDRVNVPMSVEAPADAKYATMTLDGKPVACQVDDGKLWFIVGNLPAGKTATYQVQFMASDPTKVKRMVGRPGGVLVVKGEKEVYVSIQTKDSAKAKPLTSYVFDYDKVGKNQLRRPYFWPVYGPDETTMTRPYPMQAENLPKNVQTDHPHHTSIWVAHGDVNKVDNWSIAGKAGWQIHKDFPLLASGPIVGIIRETLDWTDAAKKPNLAETRTVHIYSLPGGARMMDFELKFEAKYGKVTFGDTKEGGPLATRMRPELRADKKGDHGILINSNGQEGTVAWGRKAKWVDMSGLVDGKRVGYAMFDAPTNLRHPETWHARTYGLCSVNPFALHAFPDGKKANGAFTIEDGKTATFRYRIYFHTGDAKESAVGAKYADYAEPPTATWK